MSATPLEATSHRTDAGTTIVLAGEINGSARDALDAAYTAVPDGDPLLLDFGAVGYINSTGIALIVGVLARARAQGRPVSACGLSEHYREIFEITRLSDFMTILADEQTLAADHGGER
jgi:anti-sigma B factor antagonist